LHFAGGWWNADVEDVIEAALATGGGYSIPDALTINGQPGFLYNYSSSDASRLRIRQGESYQLRVVNACLNFAMYFAVANHSLTVRELDSAYCVPFTVDVLLIAPGQTVDCILNANLSEGQFYMAASVFSLPDPLIVSQSPRTRVFILFIYNFQFLWF
jgi:laccase